jgi:ribokinase
VGPGGQGANVAVRLARRGVAARLACALGEDAAGRLVREAIAADGIRLDAALSEASGAVAILLGPEGERTMLSQRVPVLPTVDLTRLSDGCDWLVVSGYSLLEEDAVEFASRCAALPPRRALLGCAVPDGRLDEWGAAAAALGADLVIVNVDEARALTGSGSDDAESNADALGRALGSVVVVTAARHAAVAGDGLRMTVTAATQAAAVDTTGAGDAFAAALIAATGVAWPPEVGALRSGILAALAAAAEVVGVAGAQSPVAGERAVASR